MNQEQDIHIYKAPESQIIESYLITLIDGTGSMRAEYESAIKAHIATFGYLGANQLRYQWEEELYTFLPFQRAGQGNISYIFKCIFEILLNPSANYPKNITILFISDGVEPYSYQDISNLIQIMKDKYLIQFISLAVGDQFPNSISNDLRNNLHNQNNTCPPIFYAQRTYGREDEEIYQEFLAIFNNIKGLLGVSKEKLEVSEPVYQILTQKIPSTQVVPGEPFFSYNDQEIKIDNNVIEENNKPETLFQIVKNTVSAVIIENASKQEDHAKEEFEQIQSEVGKLLSKTKGIFSEANAEQKQQFSALLEVVDEVSAGNLKLKTLKQKEMTQLQANLDKPEAIINLLEEKVQNSQEANISSEKQLNQMQTQFNKIKVGCFVRCKAVKKELDLVESIEKTIFDSLQQQKKIIQSNPHDNFLQWLQSLKEVIQKSLEAIYEQQNKFTLNNNQFIVFVRINEILRLIEEFIQEHPQINLEKAIEFLDTCLLIKTNLKELPENQMNQCEYLPQILRGLLGFEQLPDNQQQSNLNSQVNQEEEVQQVLVEQNERRSFSIRSIFVSDGNNKSYIRIGMSGIGYALGKVTSLMRSYTTSYLF